jgi:hypothetical protein
MNTVGGYLVLDARINFFTNYYSISPGMFFRTRRARAPITSDRSRWADAADIQKYSGIAPVIERSGQSVWVHRRLSGLCSSVKPSMSLPNKACNVQRGRISIIAGNARKVNPITVPSAPSHSSGYASFGPAGRPTSLTMNLSTFTPLKNAILPFPQLDGPPQTLEGTHEVGRRPFMPASTLNRRSVALLRG